MHTCPMVTGVVPHVGGPILPPGHPTTIIGGLPAARVGDLVTCAGPPDTIVKGSPTVIIGGMPAARMGDNTAHGGVIVLGHPTTMIGDAGSGGGGGGAGGATAPGAAAGAGGGETATSEQPPASAAIDPASIRAALVEAARSGVPCLSNPPVDGTAEDSQSVFAVRVVDDETGDPVPGVALKITLPGGEEEVHTTDNDGMVEIDDLETPGTCDVTCEIDDGTNDETADFVRRE
jgi:uncharacterized Zn-binding protein involved in type VI secretion